MKIGPDLPSRHHLPFDKPTAGFVRAPLGLLTLRRALRLWRRLLDRRDDTILLALVDELEKDGLPVGRIDRALSHLLAPHGKITRRGPDRREKADAAFGRLVPASVENVRRARRFLDEARPIGGTAFEDALRAAAQSLGSGDSDRPGAVLVLTDGRPTVGLLDDEEILESLRRSLGRRRARVFCFGIGNDINTHLLDRIAEDTGAVSRYVSEREDLEIIVSSFYRKMSRPVLTDVSLDFGPGIRPHTVHPRKLPDLFEGSQLVLMGRFRGSGATTVTLEGKVQGSRKSFTRRLSFEKGKTRHDYVPRLWAARRIGFLLDEIRLHGEESELREEVTELARRYGIVTPYTSYLITEDERQRGVPLPSQTLRRLQEDGRAHKMAEESYRDLKRSTSGAEAVAAARASQGLREAESLADQEGQGLGVQSPRYVQGKAFFPNGRQWIDGEVQGKLLASRQRVRFGSGAYLDLLEKHPEAQAWLSLGQQVVVLLAGEVYEIHE